MKLRQMRAGTKVRKNSGSVITSIPIAMTTLLGIEHGSKLIWELEPEDGIMKVYLKEED